MNASVQLGTIRGIPIGFHWSLSIVFVLLVSSLGGSYFPDGYPDLPEGAVWLLAIGTGLLFFVSILLHELGHAVVAQREGIPVTSITLFIFGGLASIGQRSPTAKTELRIAAGDVLMTVESTDPEFPWIVTFLETLLLKVWYPTTIATQSFFIRQRIREHLVRSGADPSGLDFMCHDFGYRGCSSEETAGIGAAAHLVSFLGSDTVAGIRMLREFYRAEMAGFSIPATEHSVICAFGHDGEAEAFAHHLAAYPAGVIACVSDTYDVYNAIQNVWGGTLHDEVASRDGRLVIRPDSGDPLEIVPWCLEALGRRFGTTTNAAGFRILDGHVRVIQGDGMDFDSIGALYAKIVDLSWSAENVTVGSGGGLLQKVNRDTCGFAFKASEVTVDGEIRPISKSPVTDPGKRSKEGRMKLVRRDGSYETILQTQDPAGYAAAADRLETTFENGESRRVETLEAIRERVRAEETASDNLSYSDIHTL